jgi:hypothetical protein
MGRAVGEDCGARQGYEREGRKLFDDGDAPYHLKVLATEVFPTGVIRVIYAPTTDA